jgi:hypothetical protein
MTRYHTKHRIYKTDTLVIKNRAARTDYDMDEVLEAWKITKGHCRICDGFYGAKLQMDHDHNTGLFRGFLCNSCNSGLGFIEKLWPYMDKVEIYLNKPMVRYQGSFKCQELGPGFLSVQRSES